MTAPTAPKAPRGLVDRCPGLLRPHRAADGALVRLRLPGGRISGAGLTEVSAAAAEFGDGQVQLTSRGNLQLRGVQVDAAGEVADELVDRISAAGLLPSPTHELVRNIVCSPLTGRIGGLADLRPLLAELDQLICATPELVRLPGRFLFGLDDGSGDIAALETDIGLHAVTASRAQIVVGGQIGPVLDLEGAARELVALALRFLQARTNTGGTAWHVRDLPDAGASLLDTGEYHQALRSPPGTSTSHPYGILGQADGRSLLSLVVPLALLNQNQVAAVVASADDEVIVTPWRGLIIPDLTHHRDDVMTSLIKTGFSLDAASGWSQVSACTGAPGCANGRALTRPVATEIARTTRGSGGVPVHVVACERRCGAPASDHVEVMVGSSHWQVGLRSQNTDHEVDHGSGINTEMSSLARVVAQARNGL